MDKVKVILNDEEIIKEIITDIGSSEKESLELYKVNKARRIEKLLKTAGVTL